MQTEIEAKFLDVDHDVLRARLAQLGAICQQPMRLMRRKNYDFPDFRLERIGGWVRVRDEGDKITLSYKQLNDRTLHGTKEVCMTVDSFEAADAFLVAIGLEAKTYQETKRESWSLGDAYIELDEWPWAKPYIEIEAPSEDAVRKLASELDLDWQGVVHGSVEIVYQAEYDATDEEIDHIPTITFEEPVPTVLASKKRSKTA